MKITGSSTDTIEGTVKELNALAPQFNPHGFYRLLLLLKSVGLASRVNLAKHLGTGRPSVIWKVSQWVKMEFVGQAAADQMVTQNRRALASLEASKAPKKKSTRSRKSR